MEELVTANGTTTALRAGSGPDLVLVHSLLTDREAFQAVVPELAECFRVTLLNLPGFHGSRPIPGTVTDYELWLAHACDDLGVRSNCIVCGNGFGGTIALAFALNHQERIGKLLLADVAAAFPDQGKLAFCNMANRVAQEGMASIAPLAAGRVYHSEYLAQNSTIIEERRRVLSAIDPAAFIAACKLLMDCDLVPRLKSLRVPALVVYGDLDQATPPALNKIIAANVPTCDIVEITGLRPLPAA
jgi:3-oxoadipate enol-lactonase